MKTVRGSLHLIPVPLGESALRATLSPSAVQAALALEYFIVENEKTARHFLKVIDYPRPLREVRIEKFDKESDRDCASALLQPVLDGRSAGVLSEAGAPAIADPGALLVSAAHGMGIRVVPHSGPTSMMLALMAAGFNGQRFAFNGYLPVAKQDCRRAISDHERQSRAQDSTQIFIETPYRNDALMQAFAETCDASTRLCIAADLTLETEWICSQTIAEWRTHRKSIGRRPCVFLLYAR